jgi:hypothetical protein
MVNRDRRWNGTSPLARYDLLSALFSKRVLGSHLVADKLQ